MVKGVFVLMRAGRVAVETPDEARWESACESICRDCSNKNKSMNFSISAIEDFLNIVVCRKHWSYKLFVSPWRSLSFSPFTALDDSCTVVTCFLSSSVLLGVTLFIARNQNEYLRELIFSLTFHSIFMVQANPPTLVACYLSSLTISVQWERNEPTILIIFYYILLFSGSPS